MKQLVWQKRKGFIAVFNLFLMSSVLIIFMSGDVFGQEGKMKKAAGLIELPDPVLKGDMSVEETIKKRRSIRSFSSKPLTTEQISQLLWATQGITNRRGFRAAPSAGALYPLEIYMASRNGFFHYIPEGHKLEMRTNADLRLKLAQASWNQSFIAQAPIDIVICAVYERITSRYGERGRRYVDIEVGHAAENLHLQAVALGLGSVPIGAFNDEAVSRILNLPDRERPIYIIPIGYAR